MNKTFQHVAVNHNRMLAERIWCFILVSSEERREQDMERTVAHSQGFYMGSYYCYHNYHSACNIKVDQGGYMDG